MDLSKIEEFPQNFKNSYDLVTAAGIVNNNYMDYLLFEEMVLAAKQGGFVVFTAPHSFVGQYWYNEMCQMMVEEGRWRLLDSN